jgi:hypothetical protein
MSTAVQSILESFEQLRDFEKRELASEIIKRTVEFNLPPLSDEDLVLNAEALFLELERSEPKSDKKARSFLRTARSLRLQGPTDWSARLEDYLL